MMRVPHGAYRRRVLGCKLFRDDTAVLSEMDSGPARLIGTQEG